MRDLPLAAAAAHGGLEDIAAKRLPDHIHTIKSKLADLAFATRHPKRYEEIVRLVAERAPSRDSASPRSSTECRPICTP